MNTVLDFILRATILLAVGLCARRWIGKGSAERRVTVLRLSLLSLIVLPLAMATAPRIAVPILQPANRNVVELPLQTTSQAAVGYTQPVTTHPVDVTPTNTLNKQPTQFVEGSVRVQREIDWMAVGLLVWLTVCGLMLSITCLRLWQLVRIRKHATPCSAETEAMCQRALIKLNVRSRVICLQSQVRTPVTFGAIRHTILLPVEFESWPLADQEAVLLHEAAHIQRFDCAWQWLATALRSVYWCHPLVWSTSRALRDDSELAADERAVRSGIEATDYAASLIAIARTIQSGRGLVRPQGVTFMHQDQLERRVQNILHARQRGFSSLGLLGLCGTLLGIGAVAGAVHFTTAKTHLKDEAIVMPSKYSAPEVDSEIREVSTPQESVAQTAAAANTTDVSVATADSIRPAIAGAPGKSIDRAKLFGSLTDSQKRTLRSRGHLYISELSAYQKGLLGVMPGPDYGIQVSYGKQTLSIYAGPAQKQFIWDPVKKRYVPAPKNFSMDSSIQRFVWDPKQKVYVPVQQIRGTVAGAAAPRAYTDAISTSTPGGTRYRTDAIAPTGTTDQIATAGQPGQVLPGSTPSGSGIATTAPRANSGGGVAAADKAAAQTGPTIAPSSTAGQASTRITDTAVAKGSPVPSGTAGVSTSPISTGGVAAVDATAPKSTSGTVSLGGRSPVAGGGQAGTGAALAPTATTGRTDVAAAGTVSRNSSDADVATTMKAISAPAKPARSVSVSNGILTYHDGKGGTKRYRVPNGSSVTMLSNGGIKVTGPNGKPVDLAKNIIK